MLKLFRKYIIFLIIIYILIILNSISIYAWDNCPFGMENDPFPGNCSRYIDTNSDNICDRSQTEAQDREDIVIPNKIEDERKNENQKEYPLQLTLQGETATITESFSDLLSKRKTLSNYHFIEIFLAMLLIYFSSKFLTRKLKISVAKERKFWNTILLFSFIGSAGIGMILVFIRDLDWFKFINFNILFWHVEFSIIMFLIGVFHACWHLKYYLSIFKSPKKN